MSRRPKGNGLLRYPLPGDPNRRYHPEAYHPSHPLAMSVHRSPPPGFVGGPPLPGTVQGLPLLLLGFVYGPPAPGFVVGSPPSRVIHGPAPQGYSSLPYRPSRSVEHPSSDKYGEGTPRDLAETAPKYGRKESSGATRRPTESNRHSDKLPKGRELTVTTRRHPDSERHSDRQAEREHSTVARRGQTTVATRRHPDSKRPFDKSIHSRKGRKSTNAADTKASSTRISVQPGRLDVDPGEGNFDVEFQNDPRGYNMTMINRDEKSTGRRSEGKATESSRKNRNTGRSRTQTIEPSRDSRNTQPTIAEVLNYCSITGCIIDDTADRIAKVMQKQASLLTCSRKSMSERRIAKLDAEIDLVEKALGVLVEEERRLEHNQMRLSAYGNRGSR